MTAQLERVRGELRDALSREVDGEAAVRQTLEEMEDEVMSSRRQVTVATNPKTYTLYPTPCTLYPTRNFEEAGDGGHKP